MIVHRDGPFAGVEKEPATLFLRQRWQAERNAGTTTKSFAAWAREQGIIISSDHGWDDRRRRRRVSVEILRGQES
jgi:hypothetical protein